jgi:hypothetical protein
MIDVAKQLRCQSPQYVMAGGQFSLVLVVYRTISTEHLRCSFVSKVALSQPLVITVISSTFLRHSSLVVRTFNMNSCSGLGRRNAAATSISAFRASEHKIVSKL